MERSSRWRSTPSGPASPNPDEITTRAFTPESAHWRATSITAAAGTAMTAISTGLGTAPIEAKAATPWIVAADLLIG